MVNLTVACVPVKHCATFSMRSFLHESVFILLFIEGHNVFLHFDIAQVKTRFTAGAACHDCFFGKSQCVPEKHRVAFSLRSFLHESVFILLFIEGHNIFRYFDIDLVKARFTQVALVTNIF